jgi:S1-C subfamily serine protease
MQVRGVVSLRVLTRFGEGLGSGFVYDKEGHVITNYHVVEDNQELEISFSNGYKARGEVLGVDIDSDIAVIKVFASPEELHPLNLGNSEEVKVGQTVVAIGNPFGLRGTMTVGIISAVGRTLDSMRAAPGGSYFEAGDLIQTDTAINPGNSGGPLINLRGEVVGINRAIRTENFSSGGDPLNSGIGFAISINIAKRVVPSIINNGKYEYPYLGISGMEDITLFEQEALGLSRFTGVYITDITPGSPADRAGLRKGSTPSSILGLYTDGDLIVAMDGIEIHNFGELLKYIINYKSPGDKVTFTVVREGQEVEVNLILGARP